MAPKAVVVEATIFILSGQPSGVGPSVVSVTRLRSDMVVRPISRQAAWNVAPAKYNHSVPLYHAPFAAGTVEKLEKRDNHAVVQEWKGRREPRGRRMKGCQPPRPQGTNGSAGKDGGGPVRRRRRRRHRRRGTCTGRCLG